jgi:hypothetical protein
MQINIAIYPQDHSTSDNIKRVFEVELILTHKNIDQRLSLIVNNGSIRRF